MMKNTTKLIKITCKDCAFYNEGHCYRHDISMTGDLSSCDDYAFDNTMTAQKRRLSEAFDDMLTELVNGLKVFFNRFF